VFSPYYAAARRRGPADPLDHCALNVVLTGARRRWCMTERPSARVSVASDALQIGPSTLRWDGRAYQFELAERACPLPRAVRGTVRVQPLLQPALAYALDRSAHHLWAPLAPRARVEVMLDEPRLHWCGEAYLDSNRGDRPLEQDFSGWQWSRTTTAQGSAVFYETRHRREAPWPLAVQFSPGTPPRPMALPHQVSLSRSGWGIARQVRSEDSQHTRLLHTLVDAPFYARSLLHTRLQGASALTVHESLDLERFRRRWVQWLLPFRMPRLRGPQRAAGPPGESS
jgi:carotenoid 1,2-hydratase